MHLLLGLLILPLSFAVQVWPRLSNRYFGIDTWRHLMYARFIRKNKSLPKSIKDRYIVSGPFGYPPTILVLLALIPEKTAEKYQFVISPVLDAIHNYIIFLAAYFLTGSLTVALVSQVIAMLTPIVVMEASNLNTRTVSYLFFSISFFALLIFSSTSSMPAIMVSFIFLFLLFYTHRFAIQAYFFTAFGFSLIEKNPLYIAFFTLTFFAVYLTGGDLYKRVLKEHLALLRFWREKIPLRFAHQFRGLSSKKKTNDFINRIYNLSFKNPYVYIIGNNPWMGFYLLLILTFAFSISKPASTLPPALEAKLVWWVGLSLLTSLLVLSVKSIRFLGEGNRYLEYAVFPLSILLASYYPYLVSTYGPLVIVATISIIAALFGSIVFLQVKAILNDRTRTVSKEIWEVFNLLNEKYGRKVRIAVFPFNLGDATMYFLKGRVLTSDSVFGLVKMPELFPVLTMTAQELVNKYNLNFIFIDKNYVSIRELKLKNYKKIYDKNDYALLKVKKQTRS